MTFDTEDEIRAVLQPMLDVFTGTDGGGGFIRFQHGIIPQLNELAKSNTAGSARGHKMLDAIAEVSRLCTIALNGGK